MTAPRFATIRTATTHEQRIGVVAHRWNRSYRYDAQYKALGFSDDEIRRGDELGLAMSEEYWKNRRYYGDPAYGSWPADVKHPIQDRVNAMLRVYPAASYFLNGREVSVTDLVRDYPANEQLQAAISVIQPGQVAFILGHGDDPVYELRAEEASQQIITRRAA